MIPAAPATPKTAIYARVSTLDQNCQMQLTELRAYAQRMGWTVAAEFVERASGREGARRPQQRKLLDAARLRQFESVLVWKTDRFGRSISDFVSNLQILDGAGVRFIAPNQGIDTDQRNPMAKLLMNLLAIFAEFERDVIVERVNAGVQEYQRAFKRGDIGKSRQSKSGRNLPMGRPANMFAADRAAEMRDAGMSWRQIAKTLKTPVKTIRRRLKGVA